MSTTSHSAPSPDTLALIKMVICNEISRCDTENGERMDAAIFEDYPFRNEVESDLGEALKIL